MRIHPFAMGASGFGPDHPIDHNVNLERVPPLLAALAAVAIAAGTLICYVTNGERYVPRVRLAAAIGFGRKLYDPAGPYFIPVDALLRLPYMRERIDRLAVNDDWSYDGRVIRRAMASAADLAEIRAIMPPRPFDLHVHQDGAAAPIRDLVQAGKLPFAASDCGWWVSAADVEPHLPEGESLDEPSSAWFVGPHDRADHDEVDRLSAEHRQWWPEVYDEAGHPLPSRQTPSLQTAQIGAL